MKNFLLCTITILLFSSCANYKNNYASGEKDFAEKTLLPDSSELAYTIFLTGNGGQMPNGEIAPAIKYFNKQLSEANENSAAILLGNNISPVGMPKKHFPEERAQAEAIFDAQLQGLHPDNFAGRPIIMAGNEDWKQPDPLKGLKRQERYAEKYLDAKNQVFFPEAGCGDPTVIELNDDVVVITVDAKWWMLYDDNLADFNDGCDVNSKQAFSAYFKDKITDYKTKTIIIATHFPPQTNGVYGGEFTAASHIFPLRNLNKNLWIPLPIIGTFVNAIRTSTGKNPDKTHSDYISLAHTLENIAEEHGRMIFVSGYEENMQYFKGIEHDYIISGSATGSSPVKAGNAAKFASAAQGHTVLKVYKDGSIFTEFYRASQDGETGTLLYRTQTRQPRKVLKINPNKEFVETKDSIRTTVYPDSLKLNVNKFLFGKFNSDLYFTDIDAPVLNLKDYKGGMKILRSGGSTQTVSLRLADAEGHVYNLRSLQKNVYSALPDAINFPLSQRFMRHFFTGINPFGALVVPKLSDAVGISHPTPKLFYLPQQDELGFYNERYGNQLYLLEERPDETWSGTEIFGDAKDFVSYRKLFEEIRREDDKVVKVNQIAALRVRYLDILLGDFDRHLDQFRFAEEETEDNYIYSPIPRDRDVALSDWDGFFFKIAKLLDPLIRMTHTHDKKISHLKWLLYQSRGFDNNFLNELTREDWMIEAKRMQNALTDAVIEEAIREMPPEIYVIKGQEIREGLTARRDDLLKYAEEFYEFNSRVAEIVGTDDNDVFEITRFSDGKTEVKGWTANKDGDKRQLFYQRMFSPDVTKEIRVYGLDNEDFFYVKGESKKGIRVRLVGGYEEDTFVDNSKAGGLLKKTIVHDDLGKNTVTGGSETKDNREDAYEENAFLYFKGDLNFSYLVPSASIAYNPDNGLVISAGTSINTYPYRKKNTQNIGVTYASLTNSININYSANFNKFFGKKTDLMIRAENFGPEFNRNYFGFGNESPRNSAGNLESENDFNFNRIRLSKIEFSPAIKRVFSSGNFWSLGPIVESVEIERSENRILDSDIVDVDPQVFERNYFAGLQTRFNVNFINDALDPDNGFRFNATATYRADLNDTSRDYVNLDANFTYYYGFGEPRRLIMATKVGFSGNLGDYYFYQAPTLGGRDNMRGFRHERFTGESMFYQNIDLRYRLITSYNNFIPFAAGLFGSFDHGRVWVDGENSDLWHFSYGGGLWVSPLELVMINAGYFGSDEEKRFTVEVGFTF